jgi:hypothetical protein
MAQETIEKLNSLRGCGVPEYRLQTHRNGFLSVGTSNCTIKGKTMDLDKDKLKTLAISESGLIFDPSTGFIYTSNPVGLLILDALKHTKEPIEIRDMIVKQYDIDA